MDLRGARVVITGASAGLGVEYAKQAHARGARVLLIARRRERLAELADSLNQARSDSAEYLTVDLGADERRGEVLGLRELCEQLRSSTVDVLINNAGRGSSRYFETIPLEEELAMVKLNVMAPMATAHAVIPQMKQRGRGALVFVSSIAGIQPLPLMATYAATKAFNLHHALGLRYELQRFGVRVLAVCPGPTDTEFQGVADSPGGARDTAAMVVEQSMRALERDAAFVVTGFRSKMMTLPARFLPKSVATWLAGKMMHAAFRLP